MPQLPQPAISVPPIADRCALLYSIALVEKGSSADQAAESILLDREMRALVAQADQAPTVVRGDPARPRMVVTTPT
jgi:hypothetical protein